MNGEIQQKNNQKKSFIKGMVTGIIIVVILGGVFMLGKRYGGGLDNGTPSANKNANTNAAAQQPTAPEGDFTKIAKLSKNDHVRGDADAKVKMIVYSDFQCPFCNRFVPTLDKILDEYKGKVALVFRHFPLRMIHENAQKAAEASECASEQGKFWEMHDKLFALGGANNLSVTSMKTAAGELKLNTSKFNDCLDSGKYASEVEKDYQDGIAGGVQGTPATFINAQFVAGALPYEQIKTIVDSELK